MNVQDIIIPIGDCLIWTFDNVLEPIGSAPGRRGWEWGAALVGIGGLIMWLRMQAKYNRAAADNSDQLK